MANSTVDKPSIMVTPPFEDGTASHPATVPVKETVAFRMMEMRRLHAQKFRQERAEKEKLESAAGSSVASTGGRIPSTNYLTTSSGGLSTVHTQRRSLWDWKVMAQIGVGDSIKLKAN